MQEKTGEIFESPKKKEVREVEFRCQKCGAFITQGNMTAAEAEPYLNARAKGALLCAGCHAAAPDHPEAA